MAKNVITIPATISKYTVSPMHGKKKRKVAAYARVSTDHEEQQSSYEAQVDYYTHYIESRSDWEFVAVYADEGITGCNTKKRDGFNRMVEDALSGRIDLIITKSVSRFARNTVDSLTTIRKLKENGTECYFEKENIWTFDGKGELLITIMSSLAQEESRSISENCTWGQRKRFSDGKVTVPFGRFLGYDRGENGNLVVNEEQAKIVRKIYGMFLQGRSPYTIARLLTAEGIPSPGGKQKWYGGTVRSILTNEKYKGDALLQKVYTTDFLTKKKKKNTGEVPQYYVEENHEAIIEPETFDLVQSLMAARSKKEKQVCGMNIFSGKIRCGICGGWYGSKVWHSNDKYRKVVWRCNDKYADRKTCTSPKLDEKEIMELFLIAMNRLVDEKEEVLSTYQEIADHLYKTDALESEQTSLKEELSITADLIDDCVQENAHSALNQEEYNKRYDSLVERYTGLKNRYDAVWDREGGEMFVYSPEQIKSATDNIGTFDRSNADIRYSIKESAKDGGIYDYTKSFAEQIDDWKAGKIPERDSLLIGGTPEVFQKIGFNALPMTINQAHVDYAINGTKNEDHTIGEDGLRQLPEALQHPVAVIASETKRGTSVVALLPFTHNGNTVIAPVVIDGFARQNNILLDSNAVTSVHGRKNAVTGLLANALNRYANGETTLFYWDKEKATALLRLARVTMPKADVQIHDGYIASIRDANSPVKPNQEDQIEAEVRAVLANGKRSATETGKKYSVKKKAAGGRLDTQDEITKQYQKTVEKILSGDRSTKGAVLMGYSPEILEKLGVPNLPMVIGSGHIYSIAKTEEQAKAEGRFRKKTNYHGMGTDFVKNLYSYLHNPVMVIASKDIGNRFPVRSMESVVAIVDIGHNDESLLVPVEITTERTVDGQDLDVHVLSSAYPKNVYGLIKEAIAQENAGQTGIFYLDIKNEAASKVAERVQFPNQPTKATVSGIILHSIPEKVNLKIQNQTQTQQFLRWFGDWQNEPTDASKIVSPDGTPKVVYYDAANSGNGLYRLTDTEAGEPVYLNMRNPYRISQQPNPQAEKEIIRRAKQKGYDGVVIAGQDKRYLAFAQTQIKSATDNVGTFDRKSADIRYSIKKNGTKKAADDGSLYDYKKSFAEQIDDWKAGKIPKRDSLLIGGTPEVFQKIGFNALPMTINQAHVDYAINGTKNEDHTIGEDGLRQLPEALQHPVAVIASETKSGTSVVALLPFTHNGNTVIAPVVIDGFARQNNILLDSNAVTSVHGRKNAVTGLLANALNRYANGETTLFYWDKENATALLRKARVTMPKSSVQIHDGYIASIRDADSPVKPKLANITESVQFKRWFGNWKENPNKSSKIVSPDGTPKVVYYDAANSGNGVYRLTDSEAGEPVYLNMRRPYRISQQPNPQAEEEIIRRAKQKGYDGVVIAGQDKRYLVFAQTQIKSATDNVGTFDRNNPNIRYSMKTVGENDSRRSGKTRTGEQAFAEDKYFKRQVDRWDELSDGTRIKVGVVQKDSALNRVGIPAERMFFDVSKIKKTLTKHGSQLSISDLKKIPELLSDPIAITEYEGARNTVNVYGNLFSANGTPIVVGVVMRVDIDGSTMISNIRTVHPRSNYAKQITDETILYLNEDKKRTRNWFHVCGNLRVPLDGTKFGFIRSISFDDGNVNSRASLKSDRSLLDDAVEKYGAIEPGETPAREVNFPQQVNNETRVRRFVRTAAETPQANEEQVSDLERAVIHDAQASYTPVSNAESLKKARAVINSVGTDAATRQFEGIVESDRMPSAADVALGEQLIHDAMQRGDVTAATHLVEKVAYIGTKAGQAVQAMRLLKRLGGASQLRYTETAVRDVQRQLVRKYGSRAPKIEVPSGLQERLLKAQSEQERADAMDDIMQNIADQMPVTLEDKWNAWRYLAMLGNLRTHIRNMVGNAVFVPAVTYKNIIGAVSESVADRAARMTGRTDGIERTKSLRATIPTQKTRNARTFARNDYKLQKDVVAGGGKYNPTDQVREKQKIFRNRALEWARTRNDKALETEDRLFQRVHYTNALASYMVANNLTPEDMTTPDGHETAHLARARRYATAEAQRATYRDASKLATTLNQLSRQGKAANLIVEGLMPFKKTPINIVKRAVEYSPIGLLDTATRGVRDLRRGSITASQFIDRLSAGMVGSQIVALGVWAAASGIVRASGSGDDDRDDYDEYTLGYQDYAIQIGDNSYTIDWMAPAVMPFMVGAELYRMEQLEQGDGISVATLLDSLSLISEPLVSLSMMDGLQNTLTQIAQSDNKIASIATSATGQYVSQAVPTFVGQLARIGQRNAKTTYIDPDSWIPTFAQKILYKSRNKIPAIPQPVIDAAPDSMANLLKWYNSHCTIAAGTDLLDSWGRATSNGSVPYRVFANMVSPGYYSRIQKTSTDEELLRLYDKTGNAALLPGLPDKRLSLANGTAIVLSADQYTQLKREIGVNSYNLLTKMISSAAYKSAADEDKMALIRDCYDYVRELAKCNLNENVTKTSWIWKINASGIDPATAIAIRYNLQQIGQQAQADGTKRTQMQTMQREYIMSTDLSAGQKKQLDEMFISRYQFVYKEANVDYSSSETMQATQMSESAQKRWPAAKSAGWNIDDYQQMYRIVSDRRTGYTKDAKRADAKKAGFSDDQFTYMWDLYYKNRG